MERVEEAEEAAGAGAWLSVLAPPRGDKVCRGGRGSAVSAGRWVCVRAKGKDGSIRYAPGER